MKIEIEPVAIAENCRREITDDYWGDVVTEIKLLPHIPEETLNGIESFSHLEIIFLFDKVKPEAVVFHGHPRGNKNGPDTGIFAQRKKDRPNRLGLTIVELIKKSGRSLFVRYFDGIDGTPVLDIKPVLKEFLPEGEIKQAFWASELMNEYWKKRD
jgi:tRNA (adenine37-N6)-methyltransferase